jgi:hypothetical protein
MVYDASGHAERSYVMEPDTLAAVHELEGQIYRAVYAAFRRGRAVWSQNGFGTVAGTGKIFSSLVTTLAKDALRRIPGVERVAGHQALLRLVETSVEFRIHRSMLRCRADWESYEGEELRGPKLNGVSEGTCPDFLLLWVSRSDDLHLWVVEPQAPLSAEEGTQLAGFEKVGGRRWRFTHWIGPPSDLSPVDLENLVVEALHPDVDLGEPDEDEEEQSAQPA